MWFYKRHHYTPHLILQRYTLLHSLIDKLCEITHVFKDVDCILRTVLSI